MDTRYTRWMPQTQRTHTPAKHLYIIILRSKYAEVVNSRVAKSVVGWCVLQRHGIIALKARISTTLWHNSNGNAPYGPYYACKATFSTEARRVRMTTLPMQLSLSKRGYNSSSVGSHQIILFPVISANDPIQLLSAAISC